MEIILKEDYTRTLLNLDSFHLVVYLNKKIFKDFRFFNQSEAMTAILDIGQGHQTQFQKRNIVSKIGSIWPRGSKCKKVNGRQKPNVGGKKSAKNVNTKIKHFSLVVIQHVKGGNSDISISYGTTQCILYFMAICLPQYKSL